MRSNVPPFWSYDLLQWSYDLPQWSYDLPLW